MSDDIKKTAPEAKPAAESKPTAPVAKPVEAKPVAAANPVTAVAPKAAAPKKPVAAKAAAPKKPVAANAAAPKKAATAKSAAPKKVAAPKKAAAAPKKAVAPAAVEADSFALTYEIGEELARFVQQRVEDNMAFAADLQGVASPIDLIKLQQSYMDTAAKAYADQFTAINERCQDMVTSSFNPMLDSFKDAGEQWQKMMGV